MEDNNVFWNQQRGVRRRMRKVRLEVERLESREVLTVLTPTTPLNDLGTGFFDGQQGGLYPNGSDVRPAVLETAAENVGHQIVPLDANGNPNASTGKIVIISIGMSNATLEFDGGAGAFEPRANADPSKNRQLVIVDGAQGSEDADHWADPNSSAWNTLLSRLQAAGVSPQQVQVAWSKQALAHPAQFGSNLAAEQKLQQDEEAIARNLKMFFPNIKITYMSSRTHAFTSDPSTLNPEPFAFESGFAVRGAIADQLSGVGNLNFDPTKGPVVAPLLSWGPYLWANGTSPRSDGFTWTLRDVNSDLTHPSASGISKVGEMLLAFFKTDPTATPWFLRPAAAPPTVTATASATSGASGLVVHFNATATATNGGSISQFAWTFDDGDFAFGPSPTKTFFAPGTYHVHLTVTDNAGNTTTETIAITVAGGAGAASAASVPTSSSLAASLVAASISTPAAAPVTAAPQATASAAESLPSSVASKTEAPSLIDAGGTDGMVTDTWPLPTPDAVDVAFALWQEPWG